jgi:hypothetical protein
VQLRFFAAAPEYFRCFSERCICLGTSTDTGTAVFISLSHAHLVALFRSHSLRKPEISLNLRSRFWNLPVFVVKLEQETIFPLAFE